jgi:glycosyltransferase involved in cell wall biosynthesis
VRTNRDVTVVIPTVGRRSLRHAARSAAEQRDVRVVVNVLTEDSTASVSSLGLDALPCEVVITTASGRGAGLKRSLGTNLARTPWVAYLDDDDVWLPHKLDAQLRQAEHVSSRWPVLASRVVYLGDADERRIVPETPYAGGPLARYLFGARRLSPTRNVIPTSTLLVPTELAQRHNWRIDLARHQDWDFLLGLERAHGVQLIQLDEPLVQIAFGESGGVSRSFDWQASLSWAQQQRDGWPPDVYSDFIVGQVVRHALAARSFRGVSAACRELLGSQRPSLRATALAMSGLLTPAQFNRIMRLQLRVGRS